MRAVPKAVVTGAAGFIGSSLSLALLEAGVEVVGVDSLTGYYDTEIKKDNLAALLPRRGFRFIGCDIRDVDWRKEVGPEVDVFHLAGQPGVRASWGEGFSQYVEWNISATAHLLEAVREFGCRSFVNSSSSSVYGEAESYPTSELAVPKPVSPYGVTKLAAENLVTLYGTQFGINSISLRYFTVFGPRQRPDMAMTKLVAAAESGDEFIVNGDGLQVRDFTYVGDIVGANILCASSTFAPGTVVNLGGGSETSLLQVIEIIESHVGQKINLRFSERASGDPRRTKADTTLARQILGWSPTIGISDGLKNQVEWYQSRP